MSEPTNKFLCEVEEIACSKCFYITGHIHTGNYWTCVHCGYQIGKEIKLTWIQKLIKKWHE